MFVFRVNFRSTKGKSSYGEILLLMAIHFHSNQLNAISDLVCTTLGMKIPIRMNTMNRIKQIFTQDIFTEQVISKALYFLIIEEVNCIENSYINFPRLSPLMQCEFQLLQN